MHNTMMIASSERSVGRARYSPYQTAGRKVLGTTGTGEVRRGFTGVPGAEGTLFCPLDHGNAERMRQVLPFTAPSPLARKPSTFGLLP